MCTIANYYQLFINMFPVCNIPICADLLTDIDNKGWLNTYISEGHTYGEYLIELTGGDCWGISIENAEGDEKVLFNSYNSECNEDTNAQVRKYRHAIWDDHNILFNEAKVGDCIIVHMYGFHPWCVKGIKVSDANDFQITFYASEEYYDQYIKNKC